MHALKSEEREIMTYNFLKHTIKGDTISIKISQEEYVKRLENCKSHLRVCLIMGKGDKPWTTHDIAKKLHDIWSDVEEWKILPLGKGFFEFRFSNADGIR